MRHCACYVFVEPPPKNIMKTILNLLTGLTLVSLMTATASAQRIDVPDAGTTSALMMLALGGLTVLRRFVR